MVPPGTNVGTLMSDLEFTHLDPLGHARMVDVTPKEPTHRRAVARCKVFMKPETTADAIDRDGWFHSGDLGFMDVEGRITFTSRLKDMLKVGGENVAPAEMEGRLRELPGVNDAAVVGLADERLGEVPVAYVLSDPSVTLDVDACSIT